MTSHMQREILDTCSERGARQRHCQNGLMSTKSKDAEPVAGILCVDIHILAEVAIAFGCPLFHTDPFFVGEAGFFLCTECGPVSFDLRAVVYMITKLKTSTMFLKILIVTFSHTFSLMHRIHHWEYFYQSADIKQSFDPKIQPVSPLSSLNTPTSCRQTFPVTEVHCHHLDVLVTTSSQITVPMGYLA